MKSSAMRLAYTITWRQMNGINEFHNVCFHIKYVLISCLGILFVQFKLFLCLRYPIMDFKVWNDDPPPLA